MNTFPQNPFQILDPNVRWAPSQEELQEKAYEQLIPPLVYRIRLAVKEWRDSGYSGASETTKALLQFWFKDGGHKTNGTVFQYYFAQREAIESVIYLYEIASAKDKYELMRFDSSGRISTGMFPESWARYVIKMATGSGKTKVLTLVFVWSYFHKLYEPESDLSRNFLIIAPNIIVLNRLRKDFDDFKVFREDPLIPENGYNDRDWHNDFQLTLHIQDELKPITEEGNLFLTNIHRVYLNEDREPSLEEEFLGKKPSADADTSKGLDLGKVLRSNKIKDLVVMNDEAHHIHDENMQWFKNIEDINNHLKLKRGNGIALQVDSTATPKHSDKTGSIFVQTICDYPLVEAIKQNIVKSPVLPDEASRAKLNEKTSSKFVERYKDFIHLGYIEWKKQFAELKSQKTPILFVMTLDTKEANQTKEYLEANYSDFKNSVLLIHTNKSGEISESTVSKRKKEELENLRKAADAVDEDTSPYKAVVSVMMLREGWDVRNVMTIVGLRPYVSEAKILPEQTLGRGLRKMFSMDVKEELVVVGTPAFIEFVESIKTEGVEFSYRPMGDTGKSRNPIIVEIDNENIKKDLDKLDIQIPVLTPRIHRDYKNLEDINITSLNISPVSLKNFTENELKEIVFTDIDGKFSHKIIFTDTLPDYRSVVGFFTQTILKDSRLVSGFNILYPNVEQFIRLKLFGKSVNIEEPVVLRNLSEVEAKQTIYRTFKKAIDDLTIQDKGSARIKNYISLRKAKPVVVDNQSYFVPEKSVYNKIIGDSQFELEFAAFLDGCTDIISFAKNFRSLNFKIEYQGEDGNIHDYFPDFFIKKTGREIYIAETKGREDLDDVRKIKRLQIWCNDVNAAQDERLYIPLYVKQEIWEKNKNDIKTFTNILELFKLGK